MNNEVHPIGFICKMLDTFGEKDLAIKVLDVFGKTASRFNEYDEIAKDFFDLKEYSKAIFYGKKTLELCENFEAEYQTSKNLVNCYNRNNYPEEALKLIKKYKNKKSNDYELILEEAFCYAAMKNHKKSAEIIFSLLDEKLEEEIEKKVYHNASSFYFRKDDLQRGLKHFLRGGEGQAYANANTPPYEKWDGTVVKDQTIIVDSQCGGGDEVMHVRFMNNLKNLGMNPIWVTTRKDLQEIFEFNGFKVKYLRDDPLWKEQLPKDTKWVYTLSLPYYLNLTVNDLGREPYLKPLPHKQKKFSYLKRNKKTKIGLFWDSGSGFEQAHFRTLDIDNLFESIRNRDASFYSLQINPEDIPKKYKNKIKHFDIPNRDFTDTFSIISNLDLVITSCTSVAHIAASIGKEVCVLTPIMEYYAWTSSTEKSWWYGDHVHIFRQQKPRDWEDPINQLSKFLDDRGI